MAGARVGYLAAAPERGRRAAAGPAALPPVGADPGGGAGRARATAPSCWPPSTALRDRARPAGRWLRGRGLRVADSDANFVLFGDVRASGRGVWQALLDRGVLVREVGPPGWLRVTVGTAAEMAAFRRRAGARCSSHDTGRRGSSAPPRRPGPGRARPRRHGRGRGQHRRPVLRPHAGPARQARLLRPERAGQGRHRDRRPPHGGGHVDRARPGAARGARRQERASPASATRWCRWTRRWCRPRSTCPGGRTWCTTSRTAWPR